MNFCTYIKHVQTFCFFPLLVSPPLRLFNICITPHFLRSFIHYFECFAIYVCCHLCYLIDCLYSGSILLCWLALMSKEIGIMCIIINTTFTLINNRYNYLSIYQNISTYILLICLSDYISIYVIIRLP